MNRINDAFCLVPDVAVQAQTQPCRALNLVGLDGIATPALFDAGDGDVHRVCARAAAFVNLAHADQRGIHTSRLSSLLDEHLRQRVISASMLQELLRAFLDSHDDVADGAQISLRFDQLVRRPALRSDNGGWRAYPVLIEAILHAGQFHLTLGTEVVYSSTCPASAALSRHLIREQFAIDFDQGGPPDQAAVLDWLDSEKGTLATPHAQRSVAGITVRFAEGSPLNLIALLNRVEQSLGTPVQTAVKREDEQAFALANGSNLMFCEDAARRIKAALDGDENIADFHIRVEHRESLHSHDAVAYARKSATIENAGDANRQVPAHAPVPQRRSHRER